LGFPENFFHLLNCERRFYIGFSAILHRENDVAKNKEP
jgi:hypothetical protein